MSGCDPDPTAPPELAGSPVLVPQPPGATALITRPDDKQALTARRDCDAVTAVKRGLREYLEQVYLDVLGVRVRFARVLEVWAESDQAAVYPAAVVMARDEATYEEGPLTPVLVTTPVTSGPSVPANLHTYLVAYSEVSVPLVIEVHATSPEERVQCSMILEDALNPVDWSHGFRLRLPHYFNQVATYEPVTTQQLDSEDNARRRWRPGSVMLTAKVTLFRPRALPTFQPKAIVTTDDASSGA